MEATIQALESRGTGHGPRIDPRAAVDPAAELGPGCTVGPFAVIGPGVVLGRDCAVAGHAVLEGPTRLGDRNTVHPFAVLGGPPQDLRHRGEPTRLEIGDDNTFREHVTVSRGTVHGGGVTRIGSGNLLMAGCHVAHDCQVGSHVVMANHATLAGHVTVHDHAVFGGMAAVGAFLRVGESAMLAAAAMVERDVPPFCIVAGDRARLRAINRVGLDRRGIGQPARRQIKAVFLALRGRSETLAGLVARFEADPGLGDELRCMLDFLRGAARGITR
jgi:UDP-N-acetylglucosamine acyltransferase